MQPAPSTTVGAVPPRTAMIYMPVQIGSNVYERYRHKQSIRLGITQIIISILCIFFNSVILGVSRYKGLSFIGHGYWCGILFMITGIFGIIAGKKRTGCQIVAFMVMCIISAVFTIFLLIFGIIGAATTRYCSYYGYDDYYPYSRNPCGDMANYRTVVTMSSFLAVLGFMEAVVAIWGSVLCCRSGVCCCSSPMMAMPAVGYFPNTGHMIYMTQVQGGQQISAPQPNFSYPQGQSPPPVYAQPVWAMPSSSIDPVFGQEPPPYTTNLDEALWMIPPATTNPGPLTAQAPPTDPYPTKERA